MLHWIIYCYQRAKSWSALLGCTRSRVRTMHFCYAAVVGVDCRDFCLPTGKLDTLGTAEVTSIAGLQGTERKKEKRKRKKKRGMGWGRKNGGWLVRLCIAETPGDGEGTGWRLLPSSLTSHSSPSLSGLRIPSTSCAVQRGNATT